jgi:hypothetical protein
MRPIPCIALVLASVAFAQAQSPNGALSLSVSLPVGEFAEKTYGPTNNVNAKQTEGYDGGIGGQFTMSFPLSRNAAFRAGLGFNSSRGTNTAPGYDTVYLRHSMFSLTSELQIFTQNAYQHKGSYIVAGISSNFERFERSFDDFWDDDYYYSYGIERDVERKTRLGGIIGFGHTFFTGSGINFVTEISYHTTLTKKDFYRDDPPATDFIKITFGLVF